MLFHSYGMSYLFLHFCNMFPCHSFAQNRVIGVPGLNCSGFWTVGQAKCSKTRKFSLTCQHPSKHLKNIFNSGNLRKTRACKSSESQQDGNKGKE